jgi:hypothetical protein
MFETFFSLPAKLFVSPEKVLGIVVFDVTVDSAI